MATTQEILSAVLGMGRQAQSNVPVIPNNGNPGGVYNMPRDVVQAQQAAGVGATAPAPVAKPDPYAFLRSSQSVQNLRDRAAQIRQRLYPQEQAVVPTTQQQPATVPSTVQQLPVLPQLRAL